MVFIKKFDMFENNKFPHYYQEKEYNCGPTVIKMICDYLNIHKDKSIDDIELICGTNNITGTTDENMKRGLQYLDIPFKRIINKDYKASMTALIKSLKSDKKVILRTLTKDIKHWIVAYEYRANTFYCSDPWLGLITYTYDEMIYIWEPRHFEAFIIK